MPLGISGLTISSAHQIQHPFQSLGLPDITHWKPGGSHKKNQYGSNFIKENTIPQKHHSYVL